MQGWRAWEVHLETAKPKRRVRSKTSGFVGKETVGRGVTSCQEKEIVVILATGHEKYISSED